MATPSKSAIECVRATLARRNRAERRFKNFGRARVLLGLAFLVLMFVNIIATGYSAFWQTYVKLPVFFDPQVIDPQGTGDPETLGSADYGVLVKASVRSLFPGVKGRRDRRDVAKLVSRGAVFELRRMTLEDPLLVGVKTELWVPADDDYDMLRKGNVDRTRPEADRRAVRQADRVVRSPRGRGAGRVAFQRHLLHGRGFTGAGACRHLGGGHGVVLYPHGDVVVVVPPRRGHRRLSGGVCPQEPL